jgi:hypothetical protein
LTPAQEGLKPSQQARSHEAYVEKYLLYISTIVIGGILLFVLEEAIRLRNTGFATKTLWDWMELLVIPLVLAIGAFYLERSERALDRETAEDRAKLERELSTDRQQEAALQAYLDRMADLILKDKSRVIDTEEVRNVTRIRTLTLLRGLDGKRKGIVVLFLYEAGLIAGKPIIDLDGADLTGIQLTGANLRSVNLSKTNLSKAFMAHVDLTGAILNNAAVTDARLAYAVLRDATLQETYLDGTDLRRSILQKAKLTKASLVGTLLTYANLEEADFSLANLRHATVEEEQLATVKSLRGTAMPNGTMHN